MNCLVHACIFILLLGLCGGVPPYDEQV
jgi:hypothetical protein